MKDTLGRRPIVVEGSCSSGTVVDVRGSGDHATIGGRPGDTPGHGSLACYLAGGPGHRCPDPACRGWARGLIVRCYESWARQAKR